MVDHDDLVGDAIDERQDVGGEQNCYALLGAGAEEEADGFGGDGVDAFEGFIEEERFRIGEERHGEGGFLFHAVGAFADECVAAMFEAEDAEELVGAVDGFVFGEFVNGAGEVEVFGDGEFVEEGEAFGKDAGDGFQRWVGDWEVANLSGAGGWFEEAREDFDEGGFACAVGAQDGADVAGWDF